MDTARLLTLLAAHKPELVRRFGVSSLALFGSAARGTAGPGSDVDLLVDFETTADAVRYFGLQFYLEDLLGCPVDLVTRKALRDRLRPYVERDAIAV